MHVHYITTLKGAYSQLFVCILVVWANHLSSPWTFTALLLWKVSPLLLFSLIVSIYVLLSHFSIQEKKRKSFVSVLHIYFFSGQWSSSQKVSMVYNNLLWMWITLFCQKAFLQQNCSIHTWKAGRDLLFH